MHQRRDHDGITVARRGLRMRGRVPGLLGWLCLAGCATHPMSVAPPAGGSVAVQFTMSAPHVDGLTLTGGTLGLEHLDLFGDVSAAAQAVLHDAAINPVLATTQTVTFANLPQGIYSRLQFNVEHVWLEGTYMGVPLVMRADAEGLRVDLRASPPPELANGDVVKLPVTVDADVWWRGADLSQAARDDGRILIDFFHNPQLAVTITTAVGSCFTLGRPF